MLASVSGPNGSIADVTLSYSVIRRRGLVPYLHVEVNCFLQRVVMLELFIGTLQTLESATDAPALRIRQLVWDGGRGDLTTYVRLLGRRFALNNNTVRLSYDDLLRPRHYVPLSNAQRWQAFGNFLAFLNRDDSTGSCAVSDA